MQRRRHGESPLAISLLAFVSVLGCSSHAAPDVATPDETLVPVDCDPPLDRCAAESVEGLCTCMLASPQGGEFSGCASHRSLPAPGNGAPAHVIRLEQPGRSCMTGTTFWADFLAVPIDGRLVVVEPLGHVLESSASSSPEYEVEVAEIRPVDAGNLQLTVIAWRRTAHGSPQDIQLRRRTEELHTFCSRGPHELQCVSSLPIRVEAETGWTETHLAQLAARGDPQAIEEVERLRQEHDIDVAHVEYEISEDMRVHTRVDDPDGLLPSPPGPGMLAEPWHPPDHCDASPPAPAAKTVEPTAPAPKTVEPTAPTPEPPRPPIAEPDPPTVLHESSAWSFERRDATSGSD